MTGKRKRSLKEPDYLATELERLGWDPVAEYIRCIYDVTDPIAKAVLIEKVWKYCFATKKSVDISGEITHASVELSPEQLTKLMTEDAFKIALPVKTNEEPDPDIQ